MANNPNLNEDSKATQFSKENQPEKKGRRPSSIKKYFKDNKISATDKVLLFENILNKHTAKDLIEMVKSKEFPDGKEMSGLVWGFVVAWIADVKKGWTSGGINVIMMERKHGKIPDKIEHSGHLDYTDITKEERLQRIKELEELARKRKEENEEKGNNVKKNNTN